VADALVLAPGGVAHPYSADGRLEVDVPAVFVYEGVVAAAEQDQVGQGGGSAVGPVPDVVRVGPRRRPVAEREAAAAVAEDQGSA
jgi:hypothetical protein